MQGTPLTRLDTVEEELASIDARIESTEQVRDSKIHQRVYDPEARETQLQILEQLKEMNFHLRIITGEEYEV